MEMIKNFAYVRYKTVSEASDACSSHHNINMKIHNVFNKNFKIFFSDHFRRWNLVSNSSESEDIDDLIPVIYASFNDNSPYNTETYLEKVFSKFGYIRNI